MNRSRLVRWIVLILSSFFWAYAIVARFTGFFMAPRLEKLLQFSVTFLVTSLISILIFRFIFHHFQKYIHSKKINKMILISLVVAGIILSISPPLYFPENHSLQIIPVGEDSTREIHLIRIVKVRYPGKNKTVFPFNDLDLQGNWDEEIVDYPIILDEDPQLIISTEAFMQAGLEIHFRAGPQQGKVQVTWDDQVSIIDLSASYEGTRTLSLVPPLNFFQADLTRKVLVGSAIIAEFLGLTTIIVIAILISTKISIRNGKTILLIATVMIALIPLTFLLDPPAHFTDPALEYAVREISGHAEGTIRQHQLLTISELDLRGRGITSLDGIQYFQKLVSLDLTDNLINDITLISKIPSLMDLDLQGNEIDDISAVANLTNLESLDLRWNNVQDLSPISQLKQLESLDLRDNQIRNIEPLSGLTKLKSLNLRGNDIRDITPITDLTDLRELNLHGIAVGDALGMIQGLHDLKKLNVASCQISDINPLAAVLARGKIEEIDIRYNPVDHTYQDGYASIRNYWTDINLRAPYVLPDFVSLTPPSFSHPAGFYENEFHLTITSDDPQAVVHYTLDGSEPTQESQVFSTPIVIINRKNQPNDISLIPNITIGNFPGPAELVFKATVVRAKSFYPDGTHSETITNTYFVDPSMSTRYTLPIISISTDKDNLFDQKTGIYVIDNKDMYGAEWERPIHIEYFNDAGGRMIWQDAGIRLQGSAIRKYPQKSFRLIADDVYSEKDAFPYVPFSDNKSPEKDQQVKYYETLVLRGSGNNFNYPIFRDTILHNLLSHTSLDLITYQPVNAFINGEYWGVYNLRENIDQYFVAEIHNLEPENVAILELDAQLVIGESGDEDHYQDMLDYIRDNDITDEKNYRYIETQMDVDNLIDYLVAEIYSANSSWPFDNRKFWRYNTQEFDPDAPFGADGRWRWLLFDVDTGFGYGKYGLDDDTLERSLGVFLFRNLFSNIEFRNKFINRFADHLNTSLTTSRVINVINQMKATIDPDLPEHFLRWNIMDYSMDVWDQNVEIMRDFARKRPDIARAFIIENFGLDGTFKITLSADVNEGYIRINSTDIKESAPGIVDQNEWVGIYFQGVPITVTAVPKPGYAFAGWEGYDGTSPAIDLAVSKNITLRALFSPVGSDEVD